MEIIGKNIKKIDALYLACGEPVFADDKNIKNLLYCKVLYSSIAFAEIVDIDISLAKNIPGVVDILSFKNTPKKLHTTAGQGFPEPSPYDTNIFNKKIRFVGDRVAAVAAESEDIAEEALSLIKVKYKKLKPILDFEKAESSNIKIHSEKSYMPIPVKYSPEKNIAAEIGISFGDIKEAEKNSDFIFENSFYSHYASHCAIEPHCAISYYDEKGRINIITTTQVPFHVRRIVSHVLDIPIGKIRVIKPRIGGGFGGKQEVFLEQLVTLFTLRNKKAAKIVLDRDEVFISARTRHPMKVEIKTGVKKSGEITFLKIDALMNTGAYGSHALTVLSNCGSKVLPLFNKVKNVSFEGKSVYTNLPIGGAYRGYGATQGYFAFSQQIDIICNKLNLDILEYYKKWHIKEGETSEVFKQLGEGKKGVSQTINSCKLSECIDIGAKEISWSKKRGKKIKLSEDKYLGVGMMAAMQGSGIPRIDMAAASIKMNEDGSFNLYVGATDIGTGSDTILAQITAEVLKVSIDKIIVLSSDTDLTPFDVGAYASSTTYVSGQAVKLCAEKIKNQILEVGSEILGVNEKDCILKSNKVEYKTKSVSLENIGYYSFYEKNQFQIQANASFVPIESPPPFAAFFAEVSVDIKTGKIEVLSFVSAVDCGQPVNPTLAEGQVEGAVVNGINYAMTEEYRFDERGRMKNPNFGKYKLYTALDIPELKTFLVDSYEKTGPFGAKSIGEIGINGPMPAIANAVYDAVGIRLTKAPFTCERVLNLLNKSTKH